MRRGFLIVGPASIAALLLWWLAGHGGQSPVRNADTPDRVAAVPTATPAAERTESGESQRVSVGHANGVPSRPRPPADAILVRLRGRVIDAFSSLPLAGAEVTSSEAGASAVAADDGSYALELALAGNRIEIECAHPAYLTARRLVWNRRVPKGGRVEPFDFELMPRSEGATLAGRIFDERGAPVRAARIALQRTPPTRGGLRPPAHPVERETGSDGRFGFEQLLPGRWDLLATAPGLEDHERTGLDLPPGSRTDLGPIRLARFGWARLVGRVVDGAGRGVPGVTMWVRQPRASREATSNADGEFEVERIAPGGWRVGFEVRSGDPMAVRGGIGSLAFGPRQTVQREIVLEGGPHFVGGQVLLGDAPAFDLEVTAEVRGRDRLGWTLWSTRTDENGRFRIEDLPAERLDLGFTRERPYALFEAPNVLADRDDHRFVFAAAASPVPVTGVVRDAAGAPLGGATVTPLEPLHDATRDRTGPDGRFHIEVVLSTDMTDLIVAERPGYLTGTKPVFHDMADASGRIALDFALSPEAIVGTVEGIVTDAGGRPLREVECLCRTGEGAGLWRTHSDSLGRFRFDAVTPGAIELHLRHRDYREHREAAGQLEPGGALSVEVQLSTLNRFARTVVLRGARGEPIPDVVVDVWRGRHLLAATTDAAGRATLRDVPAGPIDLSVAVEGYARHSMAHVVDGPRDTELVFELTRGAATLEGVLVTADGQPRHDVEVIVRQKPAGTAAVEAITYSDPEGRFRVEHLLDGDYEVSVWTSQGVIERTARPGDGPIRFVLGGR